MFYLELINLKEYYNLFTCCFFSLQGSRLENEPLNPQKAREDANVILILYQNFPLILFIIITDNI